MIDSPGAGAIFKRVEERAVLFPLYQKKTSQGPQDPRVLPKLIGPVEVYYLNYAPGHIKTDRSAGGRPPRRGTRLERPSSYTRGQIFALKIVRIEVL